jgi:hypothetical protein
MRGKEIPDIGTLPDPWDKEEYLSSKQNSDSNT